MSCRLVGSDGQAHRFLVQAEPLVDDTGAVLRWYGLNTAMDDPANGDVEALEFARRVRSRMKAAADHDLRQPLTALSFLSASLAKRLQDRASHEVLEAMSHAIRSMQSLVEGQLDYSRIEAGVVAPRFVAHPINTSLARLADEFAPLAARKGLGLSVHPCGAWVRTDPALLERMLRNLLSNAIRYTPRGRVVLGCRRRRNAVRIEVWDTGRGISRAELDRIWHEFFRSERSIHEHPGGLGLGLTIVDRLARHLGHRVDVRTHDGAGSCFAIEVPLAEPFSGRFQSEPGSRRFPALAGLPVLVLDDDPMTCRMLELLLGNWQCDVRFARTIEEAESMIDAGDCIPRVMIASFRLKGAASGIVVLHHLLGRLGRGAHGIVLSGEAGPVREREVSLAGYRMLAKPVEPDALHLALSAIMDDPG